MKICIDGIVREMTPDEITEMQAQEEQVRAEYWSTVGYGEAINAEIRKRYTQSQEFAILRQKDEKPDEFKAYYEYCEECKKQVKELFKTRSDAYGS